MRQMKKLQYSGYVRVRYAEIDGMGIVYNGNYLTYFEVGRVEFLRHYNMVYADLTDAGYHMPLIESHIEYKKPAYYDDELEIRTSTDFNGGIKFQVFYEIWRANDLLTTGYTTHIFLS